MPLPIAIRATGEVQQLENGGAVLGVFPAWNYEDDCVRLEEGDRLLLFTDGIPEAGMPGGDEFGDKRIAECARKYAAKVTKDFKECLMTDVKRFCDAQLRDDATLIVISVLPTGRNIAEEESRTPEPVSVLRVEH